MKSTNCLSEQDLILYYYNELSPDSIPAKHVADCPLCAERFATLSSELAHLPDMTFKPDHAAGTRMAARVNERLQARHRNWLPALAASVVATVALVITIYNWSPQNQQIQTAQLANSSVTTVNFNDDMPDIDFLEDLEVLKDLDVLRQIEGV